MHLRRSQLNRWLRFGAIALLALLLPWAVQAQIVDPDLSTEMMRQKVFGMEQLFETEFEEHFGVNLADAERSTAEIQQTLAQLNEQTGSPAAVLWAMAREDHLHLVLITAEHSLVRDRYDVPRDRLKEAVRDFYRALTRRSVASQPEAGQQLYNWLLGLFETDYLAPERIETLLFCLGDGLRGLPVAALYDGERYLVEKYQSALIPAFNLIETDYQPFRSGEILAMGASEFRNLPALPAVPLELDAITAELRAALPAETPWRGKSFLNETFTLPNLQAQLQQQSYAIVHLATHAEFQPGTPDRSFIEFWDDRLSLEQMRALDWGAPPPDLLVLSACRTVVGDREAELGFAGLALQAGVRSAIASRWYVSDAGTLALMSEFYRQLPTAATKAAALRQAQLKLLRGEVRFAGDRLQLSRGSVALPEAVGNSSPEELTHPFYWAGFLLLSSPW